jgi:hypothetical protein
MALKWDGGIVGAILALLGGVVTQFLFWRASLSHTKNSLLAAFRAELKVIRENIGTSLNGYRDSLRKNTPPTPTAFSMQTPVFNANAGHLGQLRDIDLVEHIVEVYNGLQQLAEQASQYKGTSNGVIKLDELNSIHMSATTAHVMVMKLHNRLTDVPPNGKINKDDIEVQSSKYLEEYKGLLEAGKIDVILKRTWHDA